MAPFKFRAGRTALLVSMPHTGTHVPKAIAGRMTKDALLLPDTDWHLEKLYDFILLIRARAKAMVEPIKARIRDIIAGEGDGWSARTLRLIQRFRRSVHEAR